MGRAERKQDAEETLSALQKGFYFAPNGAKFDLSRQMEAMVKGTNVYAPDHHWVPAEAPAVAASQTVVQVLNSTTLDACRQLLNDGQSNLFVLNFASAKNPGGGFLSGSQAQEESLARASTLFASLNSKKSQEMYTYHARLRPNTGYYSHFMIYSPHTVVFKDDHGLPLQQPHEIHVCSAPAVNAGQVRKTAGREATADRTNRDIGEVMLERIRRILRIAREMKHATLVLGAFGCGVFQNRALDVARYFRDALKEDEFNGHFNRIVFAIPDGPNSAPFKALFP